MDYQRQHDSSQFQFENQPAMMLLAVSFPLPTWLDEIKSAYYKNPSVQILLQRHKAGELSQKQDLP